MLFFNYFEIMIAFRYLRSQREEKFISVIAGFSFVGIMLGVSVLIIVMSVMNGFRYEFLNRIIGVNGHIWILNNGNNNELQEYDLIEKRIKFIDNDIIAAIPIVERQAIFTSKDQIRGMNVFGIQFNNLKRMNLTIKETIPGNLDEKFDGNNIFIGKGLSEKFNIKVGDNINLITNSSNYTAFGLFPQSRNFEVIGIFEVGMLQYDQSVLFIPLRTSIEFFKTNSPTAIEIILSNIENTDNVSNKLSKEFSNSNVKILNWKESNTEFLQAINIERNVMLLILILIILIAIFNIISGLIMLVKDKTKDIAVLRSIGCSKNSILKIFFITGSVIGFLGSFFGLIIALIFLHNIESIRIFLEWITGINVFNKEIYFLSKLPVKIDFFEIIGIILISNIFSFIATLYPSWKASSLDPVESLRQ